MDAIRDKLINALDDWDYDVDVVIRLTDGITIVLDGNYKTLEINEDIILTDVDHWEFGFDYISFIEPHGFPDVMVRIFFDTIKEVFATKME